MQFNSIEFFVFFAVCLLVYYGVPAKKSKWSLLLFGICFYSCFSWSALFVLLLIAGISWCGEAVLEKFPKKRILFIFVAATLAPLWMLKYLKVFPDFVSPIGISFFSLQAISAMADVYRKENLAGNMEEHFLYLSFFPTVVSGPIIRKRDFLKEVKQSGNFVYEDVRYGFYRIAIGFVEKFFLADQLGKLVTYVYGNVTEVSGSQIVAATILYGLQLYYDFAGYSHMAIGFAKCFGITIMENFERPYFSLSIKEFWRRWHISLSSWLRDYVYIPLGGSRKGRMRKYANLMLTFLVSGLWHGVGVNYLFWGFLHGIYQVAEDLFSNIKRKKSAEKKTKAGKSFIRLFHMLTVFVLVDFAWLFFRASDMTTAMMMIQKIVMDFRVSEVFGDWWFAYGFSKIEYLLMAVVMMLVLWLDIMEEKRCDVLKTLGEQKTLVRWSVYVCVVFLMTIAFLRMMGSDTGGFLYQNF